MPKFYIKSGQIKFIIDTTDDISAILATLKRFKGRGLITGPKICVSETGFDSFKNWKCYDTDEFIKQV